MTNTAPELVIPAPLVRYLRAGVIREMGTAIAMMQVQVDATIDPDTWPQVLNRFDCARSLLETIGVVDSPEQCDIVIDLRRWPALLRKVLETQHQTEIRRLRDSEADGFRIPPRDVPELGRLVEEVRKRTSPLPTRRQQPFLERQAQRRRAREGRHRGHMT
jgi:hypothetical protein